MYYKRSTGTILVRKSADVPSWVQWTHHSEGKTHCEECLMLDGCLFFKSNAPIWPHHPFCHCTLDPIDFAVVLMNAASYSDSVNLTHIYLILMVIIHIQKKNSLLNGVILLMMHIGYKMKWNGRHEKSTFPASTYLAN